MVSRVEQRRTTLLRLGEAAVTLFEEQGPSATIDDIANQAGVSRRTVFRYCDAKEELAFIHPLIWFDVFQTGLDEQPNTGSAANRLRQASMGIAHHIDADPEPPRRAFLVAAAHPELLRGFNSVFQRWVDRVAVEAERAGVDSFEARVIGSAVMGMVDAATRQWLMASPPVNFEAVLARGLDYIEEILNRLEKKRF